MRARAREGGGVSGFAVAGAAAERLLARVRALPFTAAKPVPPERWPCVFESFLPASVAVARAAASAVARPARSGREVR